MVIFIFIMSFIPHKINGVKRTGKEIFRSKIGKHKVGDALYDIGFDYLYHKGFEESQIYD